MQNGTIVRISNRWFVRYWERRNVNGALVQKRVSHCLGPVTTRGKHPPADIEGAAGKHMATVNAGKIPADRITTIGQFVDMEWPLERSEDEEERGARPRHPPAPRAPGDAPAAPDVRMHRPPDQEHEGDLIPHEQHSEPHGPAGLESM